MEPDPRTHPTRVKAPRNARTLEIAWADGHQGIYPHEILRGYCPCAGCQGHSGTISFVPTGDARAVEVDEIDAVGNYALRIRWLDGHESGIYSYIYLRGLCQCAECSKTSDAARR